MRKRNIKTYEQYAVDYELSKDLDTTEITQDRIDEALKNTYERIYVNYLLMLDVVDDTTNESLVVDDVVGAFNTNDFDNDTQKFYDSFNNSKRLTYLHPYSIGELKSIKTFKLRGYDIGFAIKKNGDIILVHNNESNVRGIGDLMIKKAIELGGSHLDHFDGFLTGFYKKNGFVLRNNKHFIEQYKPESWEYDKIDIYNPNKSIYVEELNVDVDDFKNAEKRYESGRPDVVYRVFKK